MKKSIKGLASFMIVAVLVCVCASNAFAASLDGTTKTLDYMGFVSSDPTTFLDFGIKTTITSSSFQVRNYFEYMPGYYSGRTPGVFSSRSPIEIIGISATFYNLSPEVRVLKWSESNLSVPTANFSCLPMLDGVKFADANKPSALSDNILVPGQQVSRTIYVSRVEFVSAGSSSTWMYSGVPVPIDNSLRMSLTIKAVGAKGDFQYITVTTPRVGMVNSIIKLPVR